MRAIVLLVVAPTAFLAQAADWTLLRGINPGQTVHVHTLDGRTHGGRYLSSSDDAIVVRQKSVELSFPKVQIKKISVRKSSKRWRNAAIGAGVGAAVGAGAGVPLMSSNCGFFSYKRCGPGITILTGIVGSIVGFGIGPLFPGYETIYRAP